MRRGLGSDDLPALVRGNTLAAECRFEHPLHPLCLRDVSFDFLNFFGCKLAQAF
jgi:hypothetical protein